MRFLMILSATILYVTSAYALTPIKFSLDWKFEGPAALTLWLWTKGILKQKEWM